MKQGSIIYKGIPASPGKFYGKALKIISSNHIIVQSKISSSEVPIELKKFQNALVKAKEEILEIIEKNSSSLDNDLTEILSAQIDMLEDPSFVQDVTNRIKDELENAPLSLFNVVESIYQKLNSLEDEYLRERAEDFREIGKRIEDNLVGKKNDYRVFSKLKEEVILVVHSLTPAQIIHMDKTKVKGIATEVGGRTGHMAILAKNFEIPAVVGIEDITEYVNSDEYYFLDGDRGLFVKNPSLNHIKYYGPSSPYPKLQDNTKETPGSYTKDRVRVYLNVNLESENDSMSVANSVADGVGLFRSEFLFLEHSERNPSEEEQYLSYTKILKELKEKPVVIRTFDLGADKFEHNEKEDNPFLGNRGIRYLLKNKDLFKKQIRALLRASIYKNLSIMIPMVTEISEVVLTRSILEECSLDLKKKKIKHEMPALGIMVETPGCALGLERYSESCDFFSVGTNDLLQYLMAVDRNNNNVSELYNPYHYSFLKVLQEIVVSSKKKKIPLSICGEIASDPNFTLLLLGLGFRSFSIALPLVKKVKKILSSVTIQESENLVKKIFKLSASEKYSEIESYLFNDHMQ